MTGSAFTFALEFLGCRTNQEETDALRSALLGLGGAEVAFPGPADVVVVNTCALTGSAMAQSRRALRRALRYRLAGRIVATGCAAQLDPLGFARLAPSILVVGNAAKSDLPAILAELRSGRAVRPETLYSTDPSLRRFLSRCGPIPHVRARATLKIQDGCPHRCGYCIVSQLRGRPVSRPLGEILDEVACLVANGFREIVLTGINLGLFASHADTARNAAASGDECGLAHLLRRLDDLPGDFRVRLSSLEPMTINEELIARMAESPRFCRHLHLAMQSGDDAVLARMLRPYDSAKFADLVQELTGRLDDCAIGVDVIAGYPGETVEAFERSIRRIRSLPIAYLHPFPFSERPGTPAATLQPSVPIAERKRRVRELRRLDSLLRERFAARWIGRPCQILVDRAVGGRCSGLSREYVRVSAADTAPIGALRVFTPRDAGDFVFPAGYGRERREPAGCECG